MKHLSLTLMLLVGLINSLGAMEPSVKRSRPSPDERRFEQIKRQMERISPDYAKEHYCNNQRVVFGKLQERVLSKVAACNDLDALKNFMENEYLGLCLAILKEISIQDQAICTGVLGQEFMQKIVERLMRSMQTSIGRVVGQLRNLSDTAPFEYNKQIFMDMLRDMFNSLESVLQAIVDEDAVASEGAAAV